MKFTSFEDLFDHLFTEACILEQHALEFMSQALEKVHSEDLKKTIKKHIEETKKQASRLEKILKEENVELTKHNICPIDLIVKEAEKCFSENSPSPLLDAAIIAFLQQIEHLEIAIYGTLKEYADQLDDSKIKTLLQETLKEETKTDTLLNKLAKGEFFKKGINVKAAK